MAAPFFDANQPPEFAPRDLWADDLALREAIAREGAHAFVERLRRYGQTAGNTLYALSFDAHRDKPRLRTHDRFGHRIDVVEFHPNYHAVMRAAIEHGVAGLSWSDPQPGAQIARAGLSYLHAQVEPGSSCPLTMTHAAVPVLQREPHLREWFEKASAPHYDGRNLPIAEKAGVTLGMGMTEKQGGSDVRANLTVAQPLTGDGEYALTGHKWFFSAPMSDGFLVTAQAPGGLSCFLLPRWRPDGVRNTFRLMRLKDKLGDWSNASSEVELDAAWAYRIGNEGRGIATILEMVMLTRLDCMLGSAGLMRMAMAQALHHCRHRIAFGKRLIEQPLMRHVLADIALETEAAIALAIYVAGAVERAAHDPQAAALARIATAIGKFWICKRAPSLINEAQECLGGGGYIEESVLPRLYRQAPLNSIWEGSGNVQCLDVLRALTRDPETGQALLRILDQAGGRDGHYDAALQRVRPALCGREKTQEHQARALLQALALLLQNAILLQANHPLAGAFCASRLGAKGSFILGMLHADSQIEIAIDRALPDG